MGIEMVNGDFDLLEYSVSSYGLFGIPKFICERTQIELSGLFEMS